MPRSSGGALVALAAALAGFAGGCGAGAPSDAWTGVELARELDALERQARTLDAAKAEALLADFARRAVHTTIAVGDGLVVTRYERGPAWSTRPYFALDYDLDHYVYLDEMDDAFQEELARHLLWASVAVSTESRQLMFELALSGRAFRRLRVGDRVDFTCELAAVIRGGKSVYCRALTVREAAARRVDHPLED